MKSAQSYNAKILELRIFWRSKYFSKIVSVNLKTIFKLFYEPGELLLATLQADAIKDNLPIILLWECHP